MTVRIASNFIDEKRCETGEEREFRFSTGIMQRQIKKRLEEFDAAERPFLKSYAVVTSHDLLKRKEESLITHRAKLNQQFLIEPSDALSSQIAQIDRELDRLDEEIYSESPYEKRVRDLFESVNESFEKLSSYFDSH